MTRIAIPRAGRTTLRRRTDLPKTTGSRFIPRTGNRTVPEVKTVEATILRPQSTLVGFFLSFINVFGKS